MLLIVDDDPRFLAAAEQALDVCGGVLLAHADQARSLMGTVGKDFFAALIDLFLPGVGGFSLILEMRRDYPDLPVIAISGALRQHVFESAKALGAADVLRKPITSEWNAAIARVKAASA